MLKNIVYALCFIAVAAVGVWLKHKHCEWLAPDHIGYCMFFTK